MRETLSLFKELLELPSCEQKSIIVLLNKLDLFKEKMGSSRKENFQKFFTEYKGMSIACLLSLVRRRLTRLCSLGPMDWEPCANYIKQQFLGMAQKRSIYVHLVVAIQTDNVKLIWQDIRNVLIKQIIESTMPVM